MVFKKFLPTETDFFVMFEKAAQNLNKGATLLVDMMKDFSISDTKLKQIYDVEQEGDIITHEVIKKLNRTFLTPVDREDIHALISRIDDILDLIWASADRATSFKISTTTPEAVELSEVLLSTTDIIAKAITSLKDKKYSYIQEYCIEINRLENRADRIFRGALAKLFEDVKDPILVIKWKDVYERLEDATDKCEDVANILEGIVLKHA